MDTSIIHKRSNPNPNCPKSVSIPRYIYVCKILYLNLKTLLKDLKKYDPNLWQKVIAVKCLPATSTPAMCYCATHLE